MRAHGCDSLHSRGHTQRKAIGDCPLVQVYMIYAFLADRAAFSRVARRGLHDRPSRCASPPTRQSPCHSSRCSLNYSWLVPTGFWPVQTCQIKCLRSYQPAAWRLAVLTKKISGYAKKEDHRGDCDRVPACCARFNDATRRFFNVLAATNAGQNDARAAPSTTIVVQAKKRPQSSLEQPAASVRPANGAATRR